MSEHDALLKRIGTRSGARRDLTTGGSLQALEQSIMDNLKRILRSRRGTSAACPEYGMPEMDYLSEGYTEQAKAFAEDIEEAIERYEPRVTDVRVVPPRLQERRETEEPLILRLEIKARVLVPGTRHKARFRALLSADGRVDLERP